MSAEPQAMTTAGLQAKVQLRRAWFEANPSQPIPEGRAEVERLFVAIEEDALAPISDHERINVLLLLIVGAYGGIFVLATFVGYLVVVR